MLGLLNLANRMSGGCEHLHTLPVSLTCILKRLTWGLLQIHRQQSVVRLVRKTQSQVDTSAQLYVVGNGNIQSGMTESSEQDWCPNSG